MLPCDAYFVMHSQALIWLSLHLCIFRFTIFNTGVHISWYTQGAEITELYLSVLQFLPIEYCKIILQSRIHRAGLYCAIHIPKQVFLTGLGSKSCERAKIINHKFVKVNLSPNCPFRQGIWVQSFSSPP